MAKNVRGMILRSHRNVTESDRSGPGVANPSVAIEPEVTGPGADRDLLDSVAAGNLPRILGNEMDEAAAQASNLGSYNGAAVDEDNLQATSAHYSMQQEEMDDSGTSQFRFFVDTDGSLLDPFHAPPTAQASGAGDENENESLEGEVDSDLDDYLQFTPAEVLERLHEYKMAYQNLQHARDTQEGLMQTVQEESDEIMCNAEDFQVRSELAMNQEWTAHQSKILEFNEEAKRFAARREQFEVDEAQRQLCEAEWI